MEYVRQRKEENPLIAIEFHFRLTCLHLETEGSNMGPDGRGFPTPL